MTESEALQLFDTLPYKTKVNLYTRCFSSGNMVSGKLEDKLDLIKLICFVTFKLRKENKELTISNKEIDKECSRLEKKEIELINENEHYKDLIYALKTYYDITEEDLEKCMKNDR